ncbi:uncharacterized protein CMU_042190 [Cryptosporidium muris RN66]|uniref:Peptidase A1 domain-containing protein n=1 Tax=Cryptosporidium muris (strain RN66) TaxID=441375 RepID=B6AAA5_CRYMR|nr:uncharacterized protein CMU_042190 [Cryptosporidium muris RN66]EEA05146.1 hypothetical protein CMU_042190 [Cryptosporidium muris RN66]|eukprot:XP_002139495.1 hypothetical protein [Cryptosporidium muris RN66]
MFVTNFVYDVLNKNLFLKRILFFLFVLVLSNETSCIENNGTQTFSKKVLQIPLEISNNRIGFNIIIGDQHLRLAIDTLVEGIRLFEKLSPACNKLTHLNRREYGTGNSKFSEIRNCYDPKISSSATWCYNSDKCFVGLYSSVYNCDEHTEFPDFTNSNISNLALLHNFQRVYDGIIQNEISLEGNDMVVLPSLSPRLVLQNFPIKLIRSNICNSNWPTLEDFDGLIGIVGSSISCRESSLWNNLMLLYNASIYSFDINIDSYNESLPMTSNSEYLHKIENSRYKPSFLYLGGSSPYWNINNIIWSESKQTGAIFEDALNLFQVYNIGVCGINLMQGISSHWTSALDFGSSCLSLPLFLYQRLISWLPVSCSEIEYNNLQSSNSDIPLLCIILKRPLPPLILHLEERSLTPIVILLDDLIVKNKDIDYLCLTVSIINSAGNIIPIYIQKEYFDTSGPSIAPANSPLILFGTLVLKSFGITVNSQSGQVGFYTKNNKNMHNNINYEVYNRHCTVKKFCLGNSTYFAPTNECMPPPCSSWLLYNLDETTNTCVLSRLVPIAIVATVVILTTVELHLMYMKQVVLERARLQSS